LKLRSTILDGEIVALDEEGIPRFQLLQKWQKRPTTPVVYVLFDLLWDSGRDLTGNSFVERRKRWARDCNLRSSLSNSSIASPCSRVGVFRPATRTDLAAIKRVSASIRRITHW
jgi:hypothetical protein